MILPSSAQAQGKALGGDGYIFNYPDKFKFGIGQHNSQKQICLPISVGPINAFRSILCPIIADLNQHQA